MILIWLKYEVADVKQGSLIFAAVLMSCYVTNPDVIPKP